MTIQLIIEILAAAFGLLGTVLLAHKGQHAGWGFAAFLASNIGWLAFSWDNRHWFMFAQQVGFTVASLYGIWTWIIAPWIDWRIDGMVQDARSYGVVAGKGGPEGPPCQDIADCTTPRLCLSVGTCKGYHVMPASVRESAADRAARGGAQ